MNSNKNQSSSGRGDAEQRLLQGLAMVLAALPELIWAWITRPKSEK